MAFKIVVLFATLALASAGYLEPEHHHQVSYGAAPVAHHYSSAPAVSYSSITRHDSPAKVAVAKTVAYAAEPSVHYAAPLTKTLAYAEPSVHYAAPLTKTYSVHEPTLKTVVAQPAPLYAKTVYAQEPAHVYAHGAKTVAYAAPQVHYQAAPQVHYQAPTLLKNVEYSKTLAYAPQYVSQPTYTKTLVAEPQPLYHHHHSAPVYAHGAPVVATKTLGYAEPHVSHVSYADNSAHYAW
ncbi:cuticle protein 16.5-like [Anopheles cruzii]|uniref:cuticle protein 16.5-like n=1 Tax=Anopheles cruzii TaxID=68878 RepID=UPI0022EC3A44|nr:cuticle protein 16.5-like [Anopheles cruzii]